MAMEIVAAHGHVSVLFMQKLQKENLFNKHIIIWSTTDMENQINLVGLQCSSF